MGAWYHFMVVFDTTQGTAANRVKLYVNGTQMTTKTGGNNGYPDQNFEGKFNGQIGLSGNIDMSPIETRLQKLQQTLESRTSTGKGKQLNHRNNNKGNHTCDYIIPCNQ